MIDGYNVVKRHPAWKRLPPAEGRERLKQHLQSIRWPVAVSQTVVVFDGPSDDAQRVTPSLQIRFASPSADAWIQHAIRAHASPSRLVIISDDRDILDTAKSHGTLHYSSTWLIQPRAGAGTPARRTAPSDKPDLPAAAARQITDELAKRWLRPPRNV